MPSSVSAPACKCGCDCSFKAYGDDPDGLCAMCANGNHAKRHDLVASRRRGS